MKLIKRMTKIGNSKGVILPDTFLMMLDLKDYITIEFDGKSLIIKKHEQENNKEGA